MTVLVSIRHFLYRFRCEKRSPRSFQVSFVALCDMIREFRIHSKIGMIDIVLCTIIAIEGGREFFFDLTSVYILLLIEIEINSNKHKRGR